MLTAAGTGELANECLEAGAISFIQKPFDLDRVLKILTEV